jgi:hypothetical protein
MLRIAVVPSVARACTSITAPVTSMLARCAFSTDESGAGAVADGDAAATAPVKRRKPLVRPKQGPASITQKMRPRTRFAKDIRRKNPHPVTGRRHPDDVSHIDMRDLQVRSCCFRVLRANAHWCCVRRACSFN